MVQYWVYLWAYQYGAYRDSEIAVSAASASDALLAAMQKQQITVAVEAVVSAAGSFQVETFHNVSLVQA